MIPPWIIWRQGWLSHKNKEKIKRILALPVSLISRQTKTTTKIIANQPYAAVVIPVVFQLWNLWKDLRYDKKRYYHEAYKATFKKRSKILFASMWWYSPACCCCRHLHCNRCRYAAGHALLINWLPRPLRSKNCWRTTKILTSHHSFAS